jgi:DNA-binding NarL/FixJ family response regulator
VPPLSVLVVDDHAVMRDSLSLLLSSTPGLALWGAAATGAEALDLLTGPGDQAGPGLVVTDVKMPGMTGLELVATVRTRWPAVPCVVYSAHFTGLYAERARAAGAAAYIEKGDWAGLLDAVAGVRAGAPSPVGEYAAAL